MFEQDGIHSRTVINVSCCTTCLSCFGDTAFWNRACRSDNTMAGASHSKGASRIKKSMQCRRLTFWNSTSAGPTGSEESTMMASYVPSAASWTNLMPSQMITFTLGSLKPNAISGKNFFEVSGTILHREVAMVIRHAFLACQECFKAAHVSDVHGACEESQTLLSGNCKHVIPQLSA